MRVLTVLSLVLAACSSSTPTTTTLPPSTGDAAYTVSAYEQLGSVPPEGPAVLSGMSHHGDLSLTLTNLGHYCEPMPSFTVAQQEHDLILTLVQPGQVSRCSGVHNMELSLAGIDMRAPLLDRVVIKDWAGNEVVSTSVVRAR